MNLKKNATPSAAPPNDASQPKGRQVAHRDESEQQKEALPDFDLRRVPIIEVEVVEDSRHQEAVLDASAPAVWSRDSSRPSRSRAARRLLEAE